MKAEERAFLTIDLMRRDILLGLTGDEIKTLTGNLTRAILDARCETIEDCATRAIDYGDNVPAARVFSQQIAKTIACLREDSE